MLCIEYEEKKLLVLVALLQLLNNLLMYLLGRLQMKHTIKKMFSPQQQMMAV